MKFLVDSSIHSIKLAQYNQFLNWNEGVKYFDQEPGQNHHRLLAQLSSQLPKGSHVADLGTLIGSSAIALATNPDVRVTTFDIVDHVGVQQRSYKHLPNIRFVQADCLNHISTLVDTELVFCDIAPHDGGQERRLLEELIKADYKGLLLLDDIHQFTGMRDLWNSIPEKKRIDLTTYGHWSGTGAVLMDHGHSLEVR